MKKKQKYIYIKYRNRRITEALFDCINLLSLYKLY